LSIIHVNFRDKEHYALIREVEAQLLGFGLDHRSIVVPADAIACALDEVRHYTDAAERKQALLKLEEHFTQRLSTPVTVAAQLNLGKPKA
jgi:hypothetical protein